MAETLRSSARVSVAVMASRVLGLLRDAVFLAIFGANWLTDAYVVAFRIPNLLRDLFAEGALSAAFVPTFTEAFSKQGRERAFQLANRVLTGVLLSTAAITVVGIALARPIATLFSDDQAELSVTVRLMRVMLPILALVSVSAVFMGILNSQRRYAAPAYAPALFNLTSITAGAILWLLGARGETGILVWAMATTAAAGVQALCQVPSLHRLGYLPRLQLAGLRSDPQVARIVRAMGPASLGLAAIQLNIFVNTHFAAQLAEGTQALMQGAFRLFYLPVGVFGVALAVVTSTRVADEAARGDHAALRERTAEGGRAVWMLATASAVGLAVLAEPILTVLFERGMFSLADVRATVPIVRGYMLGVLPYSLVKIYAPAFYALDRPRMTMVASLIAVSVNVAWSAATHQRWGAPALALGTSLAALVNCVILRVALGRLVGPPRTPRWGGHLVGLSAASVVMAGVIFYLWQGGVWLLGSGGRLAGGLAALWLALTIGAGFLTFALCLKAVRYPGGEELLRLPGKLLRSLSSR